MNFLEALRTDPRLTDVRWTRGRLHDSRNGARCLLGVAALLCDIPASEFTEHWVAGQVFGDRDLDAPIIDTNDELIADAIDSGALPTSPTWAEIADYIADQPIDNYTFNDLELICS